MYMQSLFSSQITWNVRKYKSCISSNKGPFSLHISSLERHYRRDSIRRNTEMFAQFSPNRRNVFQGIPINFCGIRKSAIHFNFIPFVWIHPLKFVFFAFLFINIHRYCCWKLFTFFSDHVCYSIVKPFTKQICTFSVCFCVISSQKKVNSVAEKPANRWTKGYRSESNFFGEKCLKNFRICKDSTFCNIFGDIKSLFACSTEGGWAYFYSFFADISNIIYLLFYVSFLYSPHINKNHLFFVDIENKPHILQ